MAKWKLSNLIRNKQIAKQNYSETSLDVYQRQSLTKGKLLPGGQARKPYTMLVGVQTDMTPWKAVSHYLVNVKICILRSPAILLWVDALEKCMCICIKTHVTECLKEHNRIFYNENNKIRTTWMILTKY